jgi:hypothetical protein
VVKQGEDVVARWDGKTVMEGLTPVVRKLLTGQADSSPVPLA